VDYCINKRMMTLKSGTVLKRFDYDVLHKVSVTLIDLMNKKMLLIYSKLVCS
jgi:hypothetical protein